MTSRTTWVDGKDNYVKHTHIVNDDKTQSYELEFLDVPYDPNITLFDEFKENVSHRNTKMVEVLYSGGMDSELVLYGLLDRGVPVQAITMRIKAHGMVLNTHDLYYAEKFCRERNIKQVVIDLEADKFFENGDHLQYLSPYKISQAHVATHYWLLEQCSGFPVFGGEHSWPWIHHDPVVISPTRYEYSNYDRFLSDRGISGIGNMLRHSFANHTKMIRSHIDVVNGDIDGSLGGDRLRITELKRQLYQKLGYTDPEKRLRSYGWEVSGYAVFDIRLHNKYIKESWGTATNKVTWGTEFANILGSVPGSNDLFR
jgi:hypothetical protein